MKIIVVKLMKLQWRLITTTVAVWHQKVVLTTLMEAYVEKAKKSYTITSHKIATFMIKIKLLLQFCNFEINFYI